MARYCYSELLFLKRNLEHLLDSDVLSGVCRMRGYDFTSFDLDVLLWIVESEIDIVLGDD